MLYLLWQSAHKKDNCAIVLLCLTAYIAACSVRNFQVYSFVLLVANRVDELLHLTLRADEMEHIVACLKTANKPLSHDLLVLHYLQQSRLVEASQMESTFTSSTVSTVIGTCTFGYELLWPQPTFSFISLPVPCNRLPVVHIRAMVTIDY